MLVSPNAKINIGLDILCKREDGFHEIDTLMLPIPLCDDLSFKTITNEQETVLRGSGITIDGVYKDNLVYKAYQLIKNNYNIPNINIHLQKNIPFGAGLGGGSADASFMLTALNNQFNLNIPEQKLENYAAELGSDCPLFIKNKPALARGRGEILEPYDINLNGKTILLIIADVFISTQAAYQLVKPSFPALSLIERLKQPLYEWKNIIKNDFEHSVFNQFPVVENVKSKLYDMGATYASLSGSGSAVFGIFDNDISYQQTFPETYFKWKCKL